MWTSSPRGNTADEKVRYGNSMLLQYIRVMMQTMKQDIFQKKKKKKENEKK